MVFFVHIPTGINLCNTFFFNDYISREICYTASLNANKNKFRPTLFVNPLAVSFDKIILIPKSIFFFLITLNYRGHPFKNELKNMKHISSFNGMVTSSSLIEYFTFGIKNKKTNAQN